MDLLRRARARPPGLQPAGDPWGIGHYLVFVTAAAIGAGLEVSVEHATGQTHTSALTAHAAITVPTAVYLATVWLIHTWHHAVTAGDRLTLPLAALEVLACTYAGDTAVLLTGLLATAVLILTSPAYSD